MTGILRGLFSGDIVPWERRGPDCEKYHDITRKIDEEERHFYEKMSLDDCQRFQALSNLRMELLSVEEADIFAYGFSLGLLLMLDVAEESANISHK